MVLVSMILFYFAFLEDTVVSDCHKDGYMVDHRPFGIGLESAGLEFTLVLSQ